LFALTRIVYMPLVGSVYGLWLFDARVAPTTAPEGANTVNTTLRLLGRVANPPVLASASEVISPAWAVNVSKSVSPGAAIVPAASRQQRADKGARRRQIASTRHCGCLATR
jgi:hypothetical protein